MRKLLSVLLAFALLAGGVSAEDAAEPALAKDLVVLFTSDVHCGIDENWGYAGLFAVKEYYAADHYVMLVDDGDALQGEAVGTMTRGSSLIDLMNTVGYDLAIPGNHDYDYGMEQFLSLAEKADFRYLSCNFNREGTLIFDPYAIREFDGVKFAFVGVTTPLTLISSTPRYFKDESGKFVYGFMEDETGEKLYESVQKAVDNARAEGADYVIVMGHLGNEEESSPWMYSDVISHTGGIDVWLDGHSHDYDQVVMKDRDGRDVIRSAVGTKLDTIGVLTFGTDGSISVDTMKWNQKAAAPALLGLKNPASDAVSAVKDGLDSVLSETVAETAVTLYINDPEEVTAEGNPVRIIRRAETNLGDLCADAFLDQSGEADMAFVNGGGIRAQVDRGKVTLNDILRVSPYGNYLTVAEVTGQQVLDALEWSVHALPGEFGGFEQVAGLTFEYDVTVESPVVENADKMFDHVDDSKPRRVRSVLVGGEPLDPGKTYKLAANSYHLLENGDGYTMFDGAKILQESVKLDNQVLIDYITETLGGVIGEGYENPYGQGRIVSAGE